MDRGRSITDAWDVGEILVCPTCGNLQEWPEGVESIICVGGKGDPHDATMIPFVRRDSWLRLVAFLESIASATPQRTMAQSRWMIAVAKEALTEVEAKGDE
jgi:hypothetical protein